MNELIRELAEQAGAIRIHGSPADRALVGYENIEKFADLLVQECVVKIETYQVPVGNSAAGEMAAKWTYASLKELRDDIKEHFGIEE
jgi:hypothetical protein